MSQVVMIERRVRTRGAHGHARSLLVDGREKVVAGVTSVAEVLRVTRED